MAGRFLTLGATPGRVHVTGSLKYDGAQTDRHNSRTSALRELAGIGDDAIVFLAGSTHEPEEQYAVEIYRRLAMQHPRLRLILVPRHPERFDDVAKLLASANLPWQRRSQIAAGVHGTEPRRCPNSSLGSQSLAPSNPVASILLVDTVGELGAWWGMAHIAFVGGSFGPRGGQNMIEPAAYGAAVSFGPNTRNFRDIVASLLAADAAVTVRDAVGLEAFVRRCLEHRDYAAALGDRAQSLVQSQLGATRRTIRLLDALLDATTSHPLPRRSAA
jgi:3-deoxy-D-manno-octulosonic-acid transferase